MTAAVNVFENVREYDTDLDVFGLAFEWAAIRTGSGKVVAGEVTKHGTTAGQVTEHGITAGEVIG